MYKCFLFTPSTCDLTQNAWKVLARKRPAMYRYVLSFRLDITLVVRIHTTLVIELQCLGRRCYRTQGARFWNSRLRGTSDLTLSQRDAMYTLSTNTCNMHDIPVSRKCANNEGNRRCAYNEKGCLCMYVTIGKRESRFCERRHEPYLITELASAKMTYPITLSSMQTICIRQS